MQTKMLHIVSSEERVALAEPLLSRFTFLGKAHIQRLTFDDLRQRTELGTNLVIAVEECFGEMLRKYAKQELLNGESQQSLGKIL